MFIVYEYTYIVDCTYMHLEMFVYLGFTVLPNYSYFNYLKNT